ncbi:hypothetical protein D3C71_1501460 [compost metagenome]
MNESIALLRISVSETKTIAPPAKASPNASRRGLGLRENSTIRLPSAVARPAARVTARAIHTFSLEISGIRQRVLVREKCAMRSQPPHRTAQMRCCVGAVFTGRVATR